MVTTLELSMYPFHENYRELVKDFIAKLHQYRYAELNITTNATSSHVTGEHDRVMMILSELVEWSYHKHGKAVFVTKIIPGFEP